MGDGGKSNGRWIYREVSVSVIWGSPGVSTEPSSQLAFD